MHENPTHTHTKGKKGRQISTQIKDVNVEGQYYTTVLALTFLLFSYLKSRNK